MPKIFTSKTQITGEVGENIATTFLKNKGFEIIERNYSSKNGEIDIIARKERVLHFVEVKAGKSGSSIVPRENFHPTKIQKILRTIGDYKRNYVSHETYQIDLITVVLNKKKGKAFIEYIENALL